MKKKYKMNITSVSLKSNRMRQVAIKLILANKVPLTRKEWETNKNVLSSQQTVISQKHLEAITIKEERNSALAILDS